MILFDIAIIFFLEIIEANLTKNKSFEEMIIWYTYLLRKKIHFFILIHSSLFYLFYTAYSNKLTGFVIAFALMLKLFDLATKVFLSKKVDENGRFSMMENFGIPTMEISTPLRYSGAFIYPLAVILAVL